MQIIIKKQIPGNKNLFKVTNTLIFALGRTPNYKKKKKKNQTLTSFHYVVKPIFEWMHIRNPDIYNPPHTQNPRIFKSSTVFTSLSNKLKCAPDIFPGHNFFLLNTTSWTILDVLAALWIPLCIYKCNVTCKMVLGSVSGTFKHI